MAPRVVLTITPGNDKSFETKVREAVNAVDGPIDWSDEAQARAVEGEVRRSYPEAEVMVTDHPINPPTWNIYRDGAPRRLHLD